MFGFDGHGHTKGLRRGPAWGGKTLFLHGGCRAVRVHVLITGRVQGVAFRETMRQEAERLGVAGWVRNLPDGRVEALFTGSAPAVDALVEWCHRGPEAAEVANVEDAAQTGPSETGFRILA